MKEHGEIEYNGRRSIGTNLSRNMFETTPAIRYDPTASCGLPSEPNVAEAEIIPLPTALVGEGKFFILTAKGDSMAGIGVDDGDLVIVREQNTCRDGDYAVVLVNGNHALPPLVFCSYESPPSACIYRSKRRKSQEVF